MKNAAAVAAPAASDVGAPAKSRLRSMRRYLFSRAMALRVLSLIVVGSLWQAWGSTNPFFASYPTQIADAAGRIFFPEILPAFITTIWALIVGLAIATPIGMAVGFAMGRSRLVEIILLPYVNAFYATPRIALIPILVMWLGIDFNLRITIVALGAVFPIMVNTYSGSRHVDAELLDTGRAFMATNSQILRTIVIPYSSPYVFAGFRIGISRGISGVITAEMTAALTGVGRILISKAKYLSTDELFVGIMTLGIFSLLLVSALVRFQHKLTPWALPERRV